MSMWWNLSQNKPLQENEDEDEDEEKNTRKKDEIK